MEPDRKWFDPARVIDSAVAGTRNSRHHRVHPASVITVAIAAMMSMVTGAATSMAATSGNGAMFEPMDVFALEWVADLDVAPDGETIAYTRAGFDLMGDHQTSHVWLIGADGSNHRPMTGEAGNTPRYSPDGSRIAFLAQADGKVQIHVHWLGANRTTAITQLTGNPAHLTWSPDGRWLAFSMVVPAETEPMVTLPAAPKGAVWAPAAKLVDRVVYRIDGRGYLTPGYTHVFVVPSDGGTPRQVTSGNFDHGSGIAWKADSRALFVGANRRDDAEYEPLDTTIIEVDIADGTIRYLTRRFGPDNDPQPDPAGRYLAIRGFEDDLASYNPNRVSLIDLSDGSRRELTADLDRDVAAMRWRDDKSLVITYDDAGMGRIDRLSLDGSRSRIVNDLGGLGLSRPYSGGVFSASGTTLAYTITDTAAPAELGVVRRGQTRRVTDLNHDALGHKRLARIEPIRFPATVDRRQIEAWVALPPDYQPGRSYPAILEIHGGPFAAYGPHFAAEIQLYAAAGYVVVYVNPRGSASYGREFANLIHHAYPGDDYRDLMDAVDYIVSEGWADPARLFVTGGSGGGILTAWIVTQTDRFRAAVAAKPIINWTSFVLTADLANVFYRYWFGDLPWDAPEDYGRRSPLSHVGNVKTPTLLMTGESDMRTPISEAEQFYQALKLARVDTALVRIPGASHGIASRPSHLISKVAHVLAWFERYDPGRASE